MTSRMDRMTTIRSITVHHDGMDTFYETQPRAVAARIELIRQRHRARGWGDIGYHFVVDRAGRVWEARPLRYQGAHVRDHNPGNIGVVVLGNFDLQSPSSTQLEALRRHVAALIQAYNVPISRVHTHQEWAATACPGRGLQHFMDAVRNDGRLLAVRRLPVPASTSALEAAMTRRTAIPVSVGK